MALFDFLKVDVAPKAAPLGSVKIDGKSYTIANMGVTTFTALGAKFEAGKKVKLQVTFKDAKEHFTFSGDGSVMGMTKDGAKIQYLNLPESNKQAIARVLARSVISK